MENVSTHSRAKAAALKAIIDNDVIEFQHTAARRRLRDGCVKRFRLLEFQHTAARRRLQGNSVQYRYYKQFQHTAARRRLPPLSLARSATVWVSTHSRAKAAAQVFLRQLSLWQFQHTAARRRLHVCASCIVAQFCFNTQPREGGCRRI